jgi:membrane fusion protein, heavy metal efflux system
LQYGFYQQYSSCIISFSMINKKSMGILLMVFTLFSCNSDHARDQDHDRDHDHDHDEVKYLVTSYSEHFEIFAEADPFVQGKTSEILVHITRMEDFKPLDDGKVTLSLITGSRGIRQTREVPVKAGIYRFSLHPEATGRSRMVFDIETSSGSYTLEASDIRVFADEHQAIHYAEDMFPDHPGALPFTKEQSWIITFATAPVSARNLGKVIKTTGEVMPALGNELTLNAMTRGVVTISDGNLYEGLQVAVGQPLITISGAGLAEGNALQRYHEARNNYERAKADYERLSNLSEERIISERELLQARNAYENAKVVYENLSENFSERGQIVRSPVNGYIREVFVSNGQYVEPGQVLASVFQNQEMVLKSEVQQRYGNLMSKLHTANITLPDGLTYSLDDLNGRILSFAQSTHSATHLLPVHLSVRNTHGLIPGTILDVYLRTDEKEPLIAVPFDAIVEEQGNYFVFVQIHPESFEKREVEVGISDGLYVHIPRGLNENERVVSKGAVMVKISAASGSIDPHSGHVH